MNDVMEQDASDLAEALAGSEPALARLYDRHAPVLFALCRRNTRQRCGGAEAEEAVQETFIRAFRNLAQLDDATRLRPWLYAIAARVCSERRRAAARRARHEENAMRQAMLHQPTPNGELERTEQLHRLSEALDQLTDDERLAVHLHYLDESPVSAALAALGVSRSGFYKLLSRAREKLAAMLRDETPVEKEPVP